MPLSAGTRIGPYEVVSALGAGGMGEVYRATDTNLKRQVAIKVLPQTVAADAERLARLQREAEVLAALNHPNIAAIYGLERVERLRPSRAEDNQIRGEGSASVRAGGGAPAPVQNDLTIALVMELVEGPTLADRLAQGPIVMADARPIARQIAEALEAAHEQGIVHRDLKPANIKVRPDGTVKVLDFGLAKAMEPAGAASASASMSPTLSIRATQAGMILGTAAYMSPEQARGTAVDKRADLWAFGVVLYEMLTGARLFEGATISDTLAHVLTREPDWAALPADTPAPIRRLLRRCLEKDRKQRLPDAAMARLEIDEALATTADAAPEPAAVSVAERRGARRERLAWTVAALGVVAVAALVVPAVRYVRQLAPEVVQTRFEIQTPPTSDPTSFALSSDGRHLAFVATTDGVSRLWTRALDQLTAQPLAGTEGASYPFWAPDGRSIGFFAGGKLKRLDLAGGTPQVLADAPNPRGGTWNNEDVIVFAPSTTTALMRVPAAGGKAAEPASHLAAGEADHRWPQFLPDGRRFLFYQSQGRTELRGVYVASLDGGTPTRLLANESAAQYAPPNHLLFVRQGVLVSLDFDVAHATVSGNPKPIAQDVGVDATFLGDFSVSTTGVLAHRTGGGGQRQLVWVDRTGTTRGVVGPVDDGAIAAPELSPDGHQVAVQRGVQGNVDVWLIDVDRGASKRFTVADGNDSGAVWSPDGRRVVFRSLRGGAYDLFVKPSDGAREEQPLLITPENKGPASWSPDGRVLIYSVASPASGSDIWALPLAADRPPGGEKPFPVVQTSFDETAGQLSPNGHWLAYQSNESGTTDVYVKVFPGPGGAVRVSAAGGGLPRWRPDGRELFYVAPDGRLTTVPIVARGEAEAPVPGTSQALFPLHLATGANISTGGFGARAQYAVAHDGRFLVNRALDEATASPITVVLNGLR